MNDWDEFWDQFPDEDIHEWLDELERASLEAETGYWAGIRGALLCVVLAGAAIGVVAMVLT